MILSKVFGSSKPSVFATQEEKRAAIYRNLIRRKAEIGGTLFGPVQPGGRREFFCLDRTTWVWQEEWIDQNGQKQIRNTRYDMRPSGVLKAQNGQGYQQVGLEEARHLQAAIREYGRRVKAELYAAS
jgi:hypothetical protein